MDDDLAVIAHLQGQQPLRCSIKHLRDSTAPCGRHIPREPHVAPPGARTDVFRSYQERLRACCVSSASCVGTVLTNRLLSPYRVSSFLDHHLSDAFVHIVRRRVHAIYAHAVYVLTLKVQPFIMLPPLFKYADTDGYTMFTGGICLVHLSEGPIVPIVAQCTCSQQNYRNIHDALQPLYAERSTSFSPPVFTVGSSPGKNM